MEKKSNDRTSIYQQTFTKPKVIKDCLSLKQKITIKGLDCFGYSVLKTQRLNIIIIIINELNCMSIKYILENVTFSRIFKDMFYKPVSTFE